jgi:hypothetical protein
MKDLLLGIVALVITYHVIVLITAIYVSVERWLCGKIESRNKQNQKD